MRDDSRPAPFLRGTSWPATFVLQKVPKNIPKQVKHILKQKKNW